MEACSVPEGWFRTTSCCRHDTLHVPVSPAWGSAAYVVRAGCLCCLCMCVPPAARTRPPSPGHGPGSAVSPSANVINDPTVPHRADGDKGGLTRGLPWRTLRLVPQGPCVKWDVKPRGTELAGGPWQVDLSAAENEWRLPRGGGGRGERVRRRRAMRNALFCSPGGSLRLTVTNGVF